MWPSVYRIGSAGPFCCGNIPVRGAGHSKGLRSCVVYGLSYGIENNQIRVGGSDLNPVACWIRWAMDNGSVRGVVNGGCSLPNGFRDYAASVKKYDCVVKASKGHVKEISLTEIYLVGIPGNGINKWDACRFNGKHIPGGRKDSNSICRTWLKPCSE